jgi:hypothetical protein
MNITANVHTTFYIKVKKYRQVEEQPEPNVWRRMLVFNSNKN